MVETIEMSEPEDAQKPTDGESTAAKVVLPENWTLAWYGVPATKAGLRRKLCATVKKGGLCSVDLGGSVYCGPSNRKMNEDTQKIADQLAPGMVRLLEGSYGQEEAGWMLGGLVKRAMGDLKEVEDAIVELERAMMGEVELINPKTKEPRNLVTTGDGRFHTARVLLEGVDTVAQRLAGHKGTEQQAELLRRRVSQVQAWVDKVQSAHKTFSAGKRPSRAQEDGTA